MKERPDDQQVGPLDGVGLLGRVHRCFAQVAVDGEGVHHVALRAAANVVPFRQQPDHQVELVEVLDHVDRGLAGEKEVREQRPRLLGPGLGNRDLGAAERFEGATPDHRVGPRRLLGDPQHEERVGGRVDLDPQLDPAVEQLELIAEQDPGMTPHRTATAVLPPAPGLVGAPRHPTGGEGELIHEFLARLVAEFGGDRVLVVERELVAGPPRRTVEGDAGRRQDRGLGCQVVEHVGREAGDRPLAPRHRVEVTQTAPSLLEIGFDLERDIAHVGVAPRDLPRQLRHQVLALLLPELRHRAVEAVEQSLVADDQPGLQERGRLVELVGGQLGRLLRREHAVAELEAAVPHRIPELLGDRGDVGALVVEKDDVEVAVGPQVTAAVAAHRDQGETALIGDPFLEQVGEPRVGGRRVGRGVGVALEFRSDEEGVGDALHDVCSTSSGRRRKNTERGKTSAYPSSRAAASRSSSTWEP